MYAVTAQHGTFFFVSGALPVYQHGDQMQHEHAMYISQTARFRAPTDAADCCDRRQGEALTCRKCQSDHVAAAGARHCQAQPLTGRTSSSPARGGSRHTGSTCAGSGPARSARCPCRLDTAAGSAVNHRNYELTMLDTHEWPRGILLDASQADFHQPVAS